MNSHSRLIERINRRDAIKVSALGLGGIASHRFMQDLAIADFPSAERLGRVTSPKVEIHVRPDSTSQAIGVLYEDAVIPWLREVVGHHPYRFNQRWVETPDGYLWSGTVQPVQNEPNQPVASLPVSSIGEGMWVQVTVPWVDLILDNPPARSPWLKENPTPRLCYSQILWVDQIRTDASGSNPLYRINERYGYGDIFLADARAFQPLREENLSPIHPDVEDKRVLINLTYQTLSCFEGNREVYFCRISSGAKYNASGNPVDEWSTPMGSFRIWRKAMSLHMSGGTTGGGYDLPGIGWATLFVGNGVAIHSTFWHNNFGVPMSHGCVNARPQDAQWIFRWTTPSIDFDPGDITVSMPGGTRILVVES